MNIKKTQRYRVIDDFNKKETKTFNIIIYIFQRDAGSYLEM